jgi:hypothetical protein
VAHSRANFIDGAAKEQAQWEYELDEEHYAEIRGYIVGEDLASLSYLSRLNPCFDMPFSELASCPNALDEQYQEPPGYIGGFSPEQIHRDHICWASDTVKHYSAEPSSYKEVYIQLAI